MDFDDLIGKKKEKVELETYSSSIKYVKNNKDEYATAVKNYKKNKNDPNNQPKKSFIAKIYSDYKEYNKPENHLKKLREETKTLHAEHKYMKLKEKVRKMKGYSDRPTTGIFDNVGSGINDNFTPRSSELGYNRPSYDFGGAYSQKRKKPGISNGGWESTGGWERRI